MTDETTQAAEANGPSGQQRTFTQQEVDRLLEEARQRVRDRYPDYDDLRARVEAHADYDEIKAERDQLRAAAARAEIVERVAAASGVPVALVAMLDASDEKALAAQAAELGKALKAEPPRPADTTPPMNADDIRKIKDSHERILARAANAELFR